jgi:hypothetical protein
VQGLPAKHPSIHKMQVLSAVLKHTLTIIVCKPFSNPEPYLFHVEFYAKTKNPT